MQLIFFCQQRLLAFNSAFSFLGLSSPPEDCLFLFRLVFPVECVEGVSTISFLSRDASCLINVRKCDSQQRFCVSCRKPSFFFMTSFGSASYGSGVSYFVGVYNALVHTRMLRPFVRTVFCRFYFRYFCRCRHRRCSFILFSTVSKKNSSMTKPSTHGWVGPAS